MNDLIKIDDSGKTTARELYEFLELDSTHFSKWCKTNILDNKFAEEHKDYEVLALQGENPLGGRPSQNYSLSIDFAKKLCMVSKSERGEQARNYFVEVEKRYKKIESTVQLTPQPRYRARMISTAVKDVDATAKQLMKLFAVKVGIAYAAAVNMVEQTYQIDMEPVKKMLPAATHETGFLNPTELGKRLGIKATQANNLLVANGLQLKIDGYWRLTDTGRQYAEEIPYMNHGHSGYQIQWNEQVLDILR